MGKICKSQTALIIMGITSWFYLVFVDAWHSEIEKKKKKKKKKDVQIRKMFDLLIKLNNKKSQIKSLK